MVIFILINIVVVVVIGVHENFTLRLGSSFPAKASSNVVFPELGGPKSNVILQTPTCISNGQYIKIYYLYCRIQNPIQETLKYYYDLPI